MSHIYPLKKRSVNTLRQATFWVLLIVLAASVVGCGNVRSASSSLASSPSGAGRAACAPQQIASCHIRLLVFSKTGAFRHASIPDAIAALRRLALSQDVAVDFTEDATVFTDANLSRYNAVVFLLTTGEILNTSEQAAFERYIQHGGGYAGVHSASDTEYDWPWYGQLVGAYFDRVHGHSRVVQATVHVIDRTHLSTSMLPAVWVRTDEWYNFASNPSDHVHVLLTVDERTYIGGFMGANHPIAWYHSFDGGRAWYTAMGHTSESYQEPLFLAHLWGGILYAAGVA
ncbi:MAG TPA: ThuA domain-containing protein [Ktedonobacteraceae bacterium]|nr:ThuA domain-containing protein [Ktedonobacteraceae bacterium]